MKRYLVSGVVLQSDEEFPELPVAADASLPNIIFQVGKAEDGGFAPGTPYHKWVLPGGETWLHFAKQGRLFKLWFPAYAGFTLDLKKGLVTCHPSRSASSETLRHLFLNQVIPLFLSKMGKLVLHAGAVTTEHGAVAFAGETGMGKSTLIAALGRVYPVLTDDCLIIEWKGTKVLGRGNYPSIRLWPEVIPHLVEDGTAICSLAQYTSKKRIGGPGSSMLYEDRPVPLRRLYILKRRESCQSNPQIMIAHFSAAEAVIKLLRFTFRLDVDDHRESARHLQLFKNVVGADIVRLLSYPSGLAHIPAVHRSVLQDIRSCSN